MDAIRLGIVGVGTVSLRGILPHLSQSDVRDRVRVQALVDPVGERAEAAAAQFGVPTYFTDLDDMLDHGEVDAVSIASPIGLHFEQGLRALEAGKHVHFNKTMCTTVEEADALIEAARRNGVHIVASPGEVLLPQVTRVRELIAEGAIGRLAWALCGCAFGQYHEREEERLSPPGGRPIDPAWYFRNPGGGPMYDMTVYALHRLTSVLGPARRVTAFSGQAVARREFMGLGVDAEADDNTIGIVDFGDSTYAVVYGAPAGMRAQEVGGVRYFGTGGTIEDTLLNGEPFDFPGREFLDNASAGDYAAPKRLLPHVVGPHLSLPEPHVYEDVMQLVDWARDGKASPVTAEHARHVVDIIESAFRSARTGEAQELRTTFDHPSSQARREAVGT
ncbi:Gfo/Idh/MocA family protein [Actinopolymorpha pittospori]|uniref:Dehydrogenase n=1 Tax=Actinopolymorpha pittospori TaxID=648752 RepID=A0A927MQX4_9ACTN|nr:Gfo/Idh/MocA family oxidoreductase [Actinopolymorpha pittospori]MBE1605240.1 putative dehydrogenase [Actinopolymorpha pittospori]